MRQALPTLLLFVAWSVQAGGAEVVRYSHGGTRADLDYEWTAQGLQARLHTGVVLWSFDPELREFRRAAPASLGKGPCGPTGQPAGVAPPGVLQLDRNGDDYIDAAKGDSARLYFGGTSLFYALDVSNPYAPSVLWVVDAQDLPGLGEISSAPAFARLRVDGHNADEEKFIVLTGTGLTGGTGTALRIVALDARTGALLWSAGNASAANLQLPGMRHDIQGGIASVDVDGDAFADRLYAGDDGGILWRIDLRNGATPAVLASGAALAVLDGALRGTPDIAYMQMPGSRPFFNIAIAAVGWLYDLRDYAPFDPQHPILATELAAPGEVLPGARGWRMALAPGETLPEATLTADGTLLFTSFIQRSADAGTGCNPRGDNRVYALAVIDGAATLDLDGSHEIDARDRSRALAQREIVHGVQLSLPRAAERGDAANRSQSVTCTAGGESLPACLRFAVVRRSFWSRSDAD